MLKIVEHLVSSPILFWGSSFLILKCAEWIIHRIKHAAYVRAILRM
ncbi:hypothetical protein MNBD_GAMMA23-749 [hydrothermal vent metagenome]|uniref:Uncharacterized protein n=1 Tax=hydrothermal vent metagenome TaxID=652676 RepID=A0A3B1AME1_9ZZZZ